MQWQSEEEGLGERKLIVWLYKTVLREFICDEITYLRPGEIIVTDGALKITTVLGSCVSVCLFDKDRRIAGMNHYMMPRKQAGDTLIHKYGDTSLEDMLKKMIILGARQEKVEAWIFGGSSMFIKKVKGFNIGEQNILVAQSFLQQYSIPMRNSETGGITGRKVVFDTSAGVISCELLTKSLLQK